MEGPGTGKKCIFPFILGGVSHSACTLHRSPNGKHLCSTKVDEHGVHIPKQGHYGFCSSTCRLEGGKIEIHVIVCERCTKFIIDLSYHISVYVASKDYLGANCYGL